MAMIERFLSNWCVAIVCVSEAERAAARDAGIRSTKIVVIPNGIQPFLPLNTVADWTDQRIKVLFVGRLDRQKGVDILLKAIGLHPATFSVRIVGEAVVSKQQPPLTRDVEYLGWLDRDSIASQMRACDVVVMPSRWEGFGLVAIEAMRVGKPVVASAVGGLSEIVIDEVTGRLVPPEDPKALAHALLRDSAQARISMGCAGRSRFLNHYSIDRTHAQISALYQSVVANDPLQRDICVAVKSQEHEVDVNPSNTPHPL